MLVSLTTIPPRSKYIDLVIRNLISQTVKPDKIILNICKEYHRFPDQKIELSPFVEKHVTINYCEDFGPICKIGGVADNCGPIMVVDDDSLLPLNAIENYLKYREILPNSALCLRGKRLDGRKYNATPAVFCVDLKQPLPINLILHVWSACYDCEMLKNITVTDYCHNDDVVISGTLQKSGTAIHIIPNNRGCSPTDQHTNNDLWSINSVSSYTDNLISEYYEF